MKSNEERIADLERRVKELESQPRETHFHYHPPVYVQPYAPPQPYVPPTNPPWIAPWAATTINPYPITNVAGAAPLLFH